MAASVIVLNGASSSGKTSIARALQDLLWPEAWLALGIDTLLGGVPRALGEVDGGIELHSDGSIVSGELFHAIERTWYAGFAGMVEAGAHLILDEVFLSGGAGQSRLRGALGDLDVLWVGVRCSPDELTRRERARGDRTIGQAMQQAELVHAGVTYDVEVDTTDTDPHRCAELIAARLRR